MNHRIGRLTSIVAAAALCSLVVACNDDDSTNTVPPTTSKFTLAKLVADQTGTGAVTVDPDLVNAWGVAFGSTSNLWVANAETGTSTFYDATGVKQTLVVHIPTSNAATGGAPTGVIFNSTTDFKISATQASAFIFAGEDGVIAAWGPGMTDAAKVADRSANNAVYKGIASAADGGANFLYATNFKGATIDVFDAAYAYLKSFTDTSIPSGYGPFGIQNIDGKLYVTYAKQLGPDDEDDQPGAGLGYVVVFNADGTVSKRFASTGHLNAPWGIARAPAAGFGDFNGAILIGNFGDGKIGAYNATTGAFMGSLADASGATIVVDGLWGLTFGPGTNATTLYFASGPGGETHGLVGKITLTP